MHKLSAPSGTSLAWLLGAALLVSMIAINGCGSPDPAEPDTTVEAERVEETNGRATSPLAAARQAQQAMRGITEAARRAGEEGRVVQTVDFRQLRDLLPASAAGIEQTDAGGERQAMAGFSVSQATGTYREDDRSLEIKIVDAGAAGSFVALGAAWMLAEVDRESSSGFERTTRFEGYPAFEKYEEGRRGPQGKIEMVVADRFFVTAEGRNVSMDEIRAAASSVDLRALAAMRDEGREE
jgi:hypothetical protein